ncbi:hypothetical protein Tco_0540940 [Tanacetum coccineum]
MHQDQAAYDKQDGFVSVTSESFEHPGVLDPVTAKNAYPHPSGAEDASTHIFHSTRLVAFQGGDVNTREKLGTHFRTVRQNEAGTSLRLGREERGESECVGDNLSRFCMRVAGVVSFLGGREDMVDTYMKVNLVQLCSMWSVDLAVGDRGTIKTVGEGVDEIDKLAELTDEMQLKQEDQGCVHASNELQLHVISIGSLGENDVKLPIDFAIFLNASSGVAHTYSFRLLCTPSSVIEGQQVVLFQQKQVTFLQVSIHHIKVPFMLFHESYKCYIPASWLVVTSMRVIYQQETSL